MILVSANAGCMQVLCPIHVVFDMRLETRPLYIILPDSFYLALNTLQHTAQVYRQKHIA